MMDIVPYLLKIRGGIEVDSKGNKAGKGPLIQKNISATLGTSQDQTLFQPILDDQGGSQISVRTDGKAPTLRAEMHGNVPCVVAYGMEPGAAQRMDPESRVWLERSPTLRAEAGDNRASVAYSIENHPNDSRVKVDETGKVQALTGRMGTGGGNVPMVMEPIAVEHHPQDSRVSISEDGVNQTLSSNMCHDAGNGGLVMEPYSKVRRAKSKDDFETWKHSRTANTLNTFDNGDVRATDVVICLQGNGIDRDDKNGCAGKGWREDKAYTLNTIDRHAAVYPINTMVATRHHADDGRTTFGVGNDGDPQFTLQAGHEHAVAYSPQEVWSVDEKMGQTYVHENQANTLAHRDYKQPQAVAYGLDQQGGKGGANYTEDVAPTLCSNSHGTPHAVAYLASGGGTTGCLMASGYNKLGAQEMFSGDYTVIEEHEAPVACLETFHCNAEEELTPPLKARDWKDPLIVAFDRYAFNQGENAKFGFEISEDGIAQTLVARGPGGVAVKRSD